MPNIQKYYELYPQAFEVVAVNADEPLKVIEPFVKDMGLSFKILLDPGSTIQQLYQIHGYPTSYFLDAEGVIRAQHIGLLSEAQLADYLTQVGAIP
jgi:peroxiredoxin